MFARLTILMLPIASPGADSAAQVATFRLALSGRAHPSVPKPKPEFVVQTVAAGGVLKLTPPGDLFTQQSSEDGKTMVRLRPEHVLHCYFRVEVKDEAVELTQVPDEYNRLARFDLDYGVRAEYPGGRLRFRVEIGKPMVVFYNVPGGGPEWTITLTGIAEVKGSSK